MVEACDRPTAATLRGRHTNCTHLCGIAASSQVRPGPPIGPQIVRQTHQAIDSTPNHRNSERHTPANNIIPKGHAIPPQPRHKCYHLPSAPTPYTSVVGRTALTHLGDPPRTTRRRGQHQATPEGERHPARWTLAGKTPQREYPATPPQRPTAPPLCICVGLNV
ncbi:uncharacterized protein LOC114456635 [Gouania willdenowi]|uniref:uncharacterized protein LOC114456635 n=1 Tax=Gouania willdenowi TaxID=441366 RepID=UPI001054679A|nr:uncharacterized protein LOC114456635 [Gouania willdenowi]